jgi:elongator complex protein 1
MTLMRQLITASSAHRDLAKDLQGTIVAFRNKLARAIDEAWVDRQVILDGVTESGGMGLDGGAGLEKARESVKGVVAEWKGLAALVG